MRSQDLQFLRPYLCRTVRFSNRLGRSQYVRFYAASVTAVRPEAETKPTTHSYSLDVVERMKELESAGTEAYPRIGRDARSMTCAAFRQRYQSLQCEESREDEVVTIHGMSWLNKPMTAYRS